MPRPAATFKMDAVVRAVKAAHNAGLEILRTELRSDGTIILHHHQTANPTINTGELIAASDCER